MRVKVKRRNKPGAWLVAILGIKDSGKSTLARALVAAAPPPVYILDPQGEYDGQVFETTADFREAARDGELQGGHYSFRFTDADEPLKLFRMARVSGGTLVVEEAHLWTSPNRIPDSLSQAILTSAHIGLNQIYISQRAASIHNNIISQADTVISFRQKLEADIKRLAIRMEDPERVTSLEVGEYIATDPLPGELAGISVELE